MTLEIPTIQTARLTLRPLLPEDAESLHHIYLSEGVLRYFPNPIPPPLDKVERFIAGQSEHWEHYGYGDWAVVLSSGQMMIGWAGLQYLPELGETEVGFLFNRPYWGKGYATEAALAALSFGFERLSLEQIIALVHPGNLASRRVIEKCGLRHKENITLWGIELMRFRIERPEVDNL